MTFPRKEALTPILGANRKIYERTPFDGFASAIFQLPPFLQDLMFDAEECTIPLLGPKSPPIFVTYRGLVYPDMASCLLSRPQTVGLETVVFNPLTDEAQFSVFTRNFASNRRPTLVAYPSMDTRDGFLHDIQVRSGGSVNTISYTLSDPNLPPLNL